MGGFFHQRFVEWLAVDRADQILGRRLGEWAALQQGGDDFLATLDRLILEITELMKNNFVSRYSDILNEYPELENEIVKENEIFFTQLRDFLSRGIAEGYLISELTPDFIYRSFLAVFFYFIKYSKTQDEAADSIGLALRCLYRGTISLERG